MQHLREILTHLNAVKISLRDTYNTTRDRIAQFLDSAELQAIQNDIYWALDDLVQYIIDNNMFNPDAPQHRPMIGPPNEHFIELNPHIDALQEPRQHVLELPHNLLQEPDLSHRIDQTYQEIGYNPNIHHIDERWGVNTFDYVMGIEDMPNFSYHIPHGLPLSERVQPQPTA